MSFPRNFVFQEIGLGGALFSISKTIYPQSLRAHNEQMSKRRIHFTLHH